MPFSVCHHRRFPVTADHIEDDWTTGTLAEREHRYAERSDRLRTKGRFVSMFNVKLDEDPLDEDESLIMARAWYDYRGRPTAHHPFEGKESASM